ASDAYEYVHQDPQQERPRAFPEVVLNVRDKKLVQLEPVVENGQFKVVRMRFSVDKMRDGKVYVSRVDGNHRLQFANGDERSREPLLDAAPFQIHIGLTREQERSLF